MNLNNVIAAETIILINPIEMIISTIPADSSGFHWIPVDKRWTTVKYRRRCHGALIRACISFYPSNYLSIYLSVLLTSLLVFLLGLVAPTSHIQHRIGLFHWPCRKYGAERERERDTTLSMSFHISSLLLFLLLFVKYKRRILKNK